MNAGKWAALLGIAVFVGSAGPAAAQVKRTLLQTFDVPGGGTYQTVTGVAEVAPGASIGRHTHFGIETGYVVQGDFVMTVQGEPDHAYKAGDSYVIPAGAAHDAKAGGEGAKIIATYVVEKNKPLATPAP